MSIIGDVAAVTISCESDSMCKPTFALLLTAVASQHV